MATFIAPVAMAQYPQLTEEAKQAYQKMMSEERRRSDEAWAKALPVVQKEAREGRPYISWASRPYDLPQARIPAFPGAEGGGMYSFGGRGGKVIIASSVPSFALSTSPSASAQTLPFSFATHIVSSSILSIISSRTL